MTKPLIKAKQPAKKSKKMGASTQHKARMPGSGHTREAQFLVEQLAGLLTASTDGFGHMLEQLFQLTQQFQACLQLIEKTARTLLERPQKPMLHQTLPAPLSLRSARGKADREEKRFALLKPSSPRFLGPMGTSSGKSLKSTPWKTIRIGNTSQLDHFIASLRKKTHSPGTWPAHASKKSGSIWKSARPHHRIPTVLYAHLPKISALKPFRKVIALPNHFLFNP